MELHPRRRVGQSGPGDHGGDRPGFTGVPAPDHRAVAGHIDHPHELLVNAGPVLDPDRELELVDDAGGAVALIPRSAATAANQFIDRYRG
jgi:hypothetical protein